jgi:hypothetical protein
MPAETTTSEDSSFDSNVMPISHQKKKYYNKKIYISHTNN